MQVMAAYSKGKAAVAVNAGKEKSLVADQNLANEHHPTGMITTKTRLSMLIKRLLVTNQSQQSAEHHASDGDVLQRQSGRGS